MNSESIYNLSLQVIKSLTPFAQQVINEEHNLNGSQQEPSNAMGATFPTEDESVLSLFNCLLEYDDTINRADVAMPEPPEIRTPLRIIQDEIDKYEKLDRPPDVSCDVLNWWNIHKDSLPMLSKLARGVLGIPASSAAAESNFSSAGFVLSERRSQLNTSLVQSILVCRSNNDLL